MSPSINPSTFSPPLWDGCGSISFLWQSLQPPINPFAGFWNTHITGIPLLDTATAAVPRFSLKATYAQTVDFATVGFFLMPTCIVGWWQSLRCKNVAGFRWIAAAGVFGFLLAVSQVVPSTIGRSFMGFIFLLIPLAVAGLPEIRPRLLKVLLVCITASAGISIALDASRPIVPTKIIAPLLLRLGESSASTASLISKFISFRDRSEAGVELFREIPPGSRVAIISGAGDPLVVAWTEASAASVHLAPANADFEWLQDLNVDAIVVTGTGPEMHPSLIKELEKTYRRTSSGKYLVRLQRGKEKWDLYSK